MKITSQPNDRPAFQPLRDTYQNRRAPLNFVSPLARTESDRELSLAPHLLPLGILHIVHREIDRDVYVDLLCLPGLALPESRVPAKAP